MKKRTVLIVGIVFALAAAVPVSLAAFYLTRKSQTQPSPKPISFYIDQTISQEKAAELKNLINASSNITAVQSDSVEAADLRITSTKTSDSIVLEERQVGRPTELKNSVVVEASKEPVVFVSSTARGDIIKNLLVSKYANLNKPKSWSMNIAGDIIVGRTVYEQEMRRNDYTSSFHLVKDMLSDADYTVADAEWTAADGIPHALQGMSFSSPSKSLDGLSYAGIDAVSLANNHSMNGGTPAFEQMLASLKQRGIGYFGAGKNFAEAHTPYIADIKDVKIAFLGYTSIPGNFEAGESSTGNAFVKISPWFTFNEASVAQVEQDIRLAKTKADVVIPYFHWSQEYVHQPNEQMRTLARRAVDAGASMVVGSHPHWVQGLEWYKDTLIAYSLGNFVFDQEQMLKTKQGVVLRTRFENNKLIRAELVPIQIEQYFQPHILESPGKEGVLNDIYSNSLWN